MKVVYRVLNALMGVGMLLSAFFANFIKVTLGTSTNLDEFFLNISNDANSGVAVAESFSIKRMIDFFSGKDELSIMLQIKGDKPFLWPKEFYGLNTRLAVFGICFVLMLAIALFIIIFSCVSGKRLPMLIASTAGIVITIVFISVFKSMSYSILSGEVNVIDYLANQIFGSNLLVTLLGSAASSAVVLYLTLDLVHTLFLVLFIGVAVWTAIFYLVDMGDPKAKQEREAEKKAKAEKKAAKKEAREKKKQEKLAKKEEAV